MAYWTTRKGLNGCIAWFVTAVCAVDPTLALGAEHQCIVDKLRPSKGEVLAAHVMNEIKSEPLFVNTKEGTIRHPVWATKNFDGYQLADHNVPEGQVIILGFVENGQDTSNQLPVLEVAFMLNIEKKNNGHRPFIIAAKIPSGLIAEGHCNLEH